MTRKKKPLAVEIAWSQLLLCGGEWRTRKAIYEELLAEGHKRKYVDWYVFCLSGHQPKEKIMVYEQQLKWLIERFKLNEDQLFSLNMDLHLIALQKGIFVFQVASELIEAAQKQDAILPVETQEFDERNTKYLEEARGITVDITNTDGWDLNAVERLVARHLYDFAQEINQGEKIDG